MALLVVYNPSEILALRKMPQGSLQLLVSFMVDFFVSLGLMLKSLIP
jgi:hypothetical protein